jgi:hypothetical protein
VRIKTRFYKMADWLRVSLSPRRHGPADERAMAAAEAKRERRRERNKRNWAREETRP